MKKINIALVDSNYIQRNMTLELIDEYLARAHLRARLEWFESGPGLLEEIRINGRFDIYILETAMPDMNGIRLARELRARGDRGKIIYITQNPSYAVKAFEVKATNYLLKPVSKERLRATLDEVIVEINKNSMIPVIEIKTKTGYMRVPVDDIGYIDMVDRALCYHLEDGREPCSICLRGRFVDAVSNILEQPWFVLAGATHVFNVQHISSIEKSLVVMKSGESVDIPRAAYPILLRVWRESLL